MYKEDEIVRLQSIQKKLNDIFSIIKRHGSITKALDDIEGQPAILMLLVASAEQFTKLQKINSPILDNFDTKDIKGIIDVRNFIAHDYEGVNLSVIEDGLRFEIPKVLNIINKLLEDNK